jgi:outer membrane protein assembly factor BamB
VDGSLYIINIFDIDCLNAANGHQLWSAYTGDELYVSPSYADGKIYVATSERHIFVLNTLASGAKIATGTTPSSSWSSPTIANGMLYIGCNDWGVYCFSEGITTASSNAASSDNIAMGHDLVIVVVVMATVAIAALFTASYVSRKKDEKPSAGPSKP